MYFYAPVNVPGTRHSEIKFVSVERNSFPEVTLAEYGDNNYGLALRCMAVQPSRDLYAVVINAAAEETRVEGELLEEPTQEIQVPPWGWSPQIGGVAQFLSALPKTIVIEDEDYGTLALTPGDPDLVVVSELVRCYRIRYTGDHGYWCDLQAMVPWMSPAAHLTFDIGWHSWLDEDKDRFVCNFNAVVQAETLERYEVKLSPGADEPFLANYSDKAVTTGAISMDHACAPRFKAVLEFTFLPSDEPDSEPWPDDPASEALRESAKKGFTAQFGRVAPDDGFLAAETTGVYVDPGYLLPFPAVESLFDERYGEGRAYSATSGSQNNQCHGHLVDLHEHFMMDTMFVLEQAAMGLGGLRISNPREADGSLVLSTNHKEMLTHREIVHSSSKDFLGKSKAPPGTGINGRNARDKQHNDDYALSAWCAITGGLDWHAQNWIASRANLRHLDSQIINFGIQTDRAHGRFTASAADMLTVLTEEADRVGLQAAMDVFLTKHIDGWLGKEAMAKQLQDQQRRRILIGSLHSGTDYAPYEAALAAWGHYKGGCVAKDAATRHLYWNSAVLLARSVVCAIGEQGSPDGSEDSTGRFYLNYLAPYNDGIETPAAPPQTSDYMDFGGYLAVSVFLKLQGLLVAFGDSNDDLIEKAKRILEWRDMHDQPTSRESAHWRVDL